MSYNRYQIHLTLNRFPLSIPVVVIGLVALYWTSLAINTGFLPSITRTVTGIALLTIVPGALLARRLRVGTRSPGLFILFSVGLSFATLTALVLVASLVLPPFGVGSPLSVLPFSMLVTGTVLTLLGLDVALDDEPVGFDTILHGSLTNLLLLTTLPILATAGAILMNLVGSNSGMFVFVIGTVILVFLASTRILSPSLYTAALFSLSLSTLLHRNLVTGHVVGADVQLGYFASQLVLNNQLWAPHLGGSFLSLLTVTAVPAVISTLSDLTLTIVFKVVYVLLYSLVPVGVFYVTREMIGDDGALYAGLFFLFYHGSFFFTPGKQLISEVFVVLLLLLLIQNDLTKFGPRVVGLLLAFGLVNSHYGTTYAYGFALLVATISLLVVQRVVGSFDHDLRLRYPVLLLVIATGWYAFVFPDLLVRISSIIPSVLAQLEGLLTGQVVTSGASYVSQQSTVLQEIQLLIYVLLTVLTVVGLVVKVGIEGLHLRRGEPPEHIEFTALALPIFAILASSYFVVPSLGADRVYQLTLPILAPFLPIGYFYSLRSIRAVVPPADRVGRFLPRWSVLAVLLGAFFVFNSGMAFAVSGTSASYTFDSEAHDFAFSEAELEAGMWLKEHAGIERLERYGERPPDEVRVSTDPKSYQMFRSMFPEDHYNVNVVPFKDKWHPQLEPSRVDGGYLFIRKRGIYEGGGPVPVSYLSDSNASQFSTNYSVVYSNSAVTILYTGNETTRRPSERMGPIR